MQYMRNIEADDLVRAVVALRPGGVGGELVSAVSVPVWCGDNELDCGQSETRKNHLLELADTLEGRNQHRLLKFKEKKSQKGLVYFGLSDRAEQAREVARNSGWFEVPWDKFAGRWDWHNAV